MPREPSNFCDRLPIREHVRSLHPQGDTTIAPATRDYAGFLVEVKTRIRRGQYQALRAVNAELVQLYWDIGESIHRKQENLGWGRSVVETATR